MTPRRWQAVSLLQDRGDSEQAKVMAAIAETELSKRRERLAERKEKRRENRPRALELSRRLVPAQYRPLLGRAPGDCAAMAIATFSAPSRVYKASCPAPWVICRRGPMIAC